MKMASSVNTPLMDAIYLSNSTQVAKRTGEKPGKNYLYLHLVLFLATRAGVGSIDISRQRHFGNRVELVGNRVEPVGSRVEPVTIGV